MIPSLASCRRHWLHAIDADAHGIPVDAWLAAALASRAISCNLVQSRGICAPADGLKCTVGAVGAIGSAGLPFQ